MKRGMDDEEDDYFAKISEERDTPDAKFDSHEEAWKKVMTDGKVVK